MENLRGKTHILKKFLTTPKGGGGNFGLVPKGNFGLVPKGGRGLNILVKSFLKTVLKTLFSCYRGFLGNSKFLVFGGGRKFLDTPRRGGVFGRVINRAKKLDQFFQMLLKHIFVVLGIHSWNFDFRSLERGMEIFGCGANGAKNFGGVIKGGKQKNLTVNCFEFLRGQIVCCLKMSQRGSYCLMDLLSKQLPNRRF